MIGFGAQSIEGSGLHVSKVVILAYDVDLGHHWQVTTLAYGLIVKGSGACMLARVAAERAGYMTEIICLIVMAALTDVVTAVFAAMQMQVGAIRYVFKASMRTAKSAHGADAILVAVAAVYVSAFSTFAIHIIVSATLWSLALAAVDGVHVIIVGAILFQHPVMLFAVMYATVLAHCRMCALINDIIVLWRVWLYIELMVTERAD